MEPTGHLPHAGSYGFPLVEKPERTRPDRRLVVRLVLLTMLISVAAYVVFDLLAGRVVGEIAGWVAEGVGLTLVVWLPRRPDRVQR